MKTIINKYLFMGICDRKIQGGRLEWVHKYPRDVWWMIKDRIASGGAWITSMKNRKQKRGWTNLCENGWVDRVKEILECDCRGSRVVRVWEECVEGALCPGASPPDLDEMPRRAAFGRIERWILPAGACGIKGHLFSLSFFLSEGLSGPSYLPDTARCSYST